MNIYLFNKYFLPLLCMAVTVSCESYYTVNAPGSLKPNRKYPVFVTLHEAEGPSSIRVSIKGPSFNQAKDVNVEPFQTQMVEFNTKNLKDGDYILRAEGLSGVIFKNESRLTALVSEGPHIYIQSDKAIYKPEDVVRFRALILDEHTRPADIDAPIRVEILDPRRNSVKQFKNITLINGIFTGKFQLAKQPTLGYWEIVVAIDGTYNFTGRKSFDVREYVLPKFSVFIKCPANVLLADGNINVGVYGKYTFGKFVEGNATIYLRTHSFLLADSRIDLQRIGFVDFNLKKIKNVESYDYLYIDVYLAEKYTGNTQKATKLVNLRGQRYNLEVPDEEISFQDNKPYKIKVYVKHWTGAPVLDHKTPVTMKHGRHVLEAYIDETGAATFEFEHDQNANHVFEFKDSKTEFPNIYRTSSLMSDAKEYYCDLRLVDKKLKVTKPVLIEVSSIANIPYLMYTIMGHGSIISHEYIKVPPNQKSYTIKIKPSIEMIPQSYIYVYYVDNGNLRYQEMFLSFPYEFENQISLSAPRESKPGDNITITVNAQPESYVGILAVDLGVYLLDNSYDLKEYKVFGDLYSDRSYILAPESNYPGILSGLLTFTNAHYPFNLITPYPSGGGGGGGDGPKFRQKFPETWIFDNYLINETTTHLNFQVPDTVTTWSVTAFSNNHVTGFGIVKKPSEIVAFQPFFLSLDLPYSVKRGEIVTIQVTVFNYFKQPLDTKVVLYNDEKEFYFVESNEQGTKNSTDNTQQTKQLKIAPRKGKSVKFRIYTAKAGEISIKATANSSMHSDGVIEKLKVEPEGVPKQNSQELYLSVPKGEKIMSTLNLGEPESSVPDSDYITFAVGGHYLVPTVKNFQKLVEVPTGTGEKNMLNFAPSVLLLQYLKLEDKFSKEKELVENLKSFIELSYQQQLSFRHDNGGYSTYGMGTDEEPSCWLTAYVLRFFIKASQFIDIEAKVIEADFDFLASQQQQNGEFVDDEDVLTRNFQNEYDLTAYVLLAFLEDQHYANKYKRVIQKGLDYLNKTESSFDDINSLCLKASVIKRSNSDDADALIDQIRAYGRESNGLRWWSLDDNNLANDIEVTATAALTLLDTPGDHTPILKWLLQHRNANGGFVSSSDTVVAMEALVKFSEKYKKNDNVNLKVSYTAKDDQDNEVANDEFYVDTNNVLKLQVHELPKTTRQLTFEMEGNGASLVQLNHQYNIDSVQESQYFDIEVEPLVKNPKEIDLKLCFTYLEDTNSTNDITNTVIIEVNLPSGFRVETENEMVLKANKLVRKFETKNSESVIIFYLNDLEANVNQCIRIPVDKINEIAMPQPAPIIVYDYYNLTRSNTKFYSL